MVEQVKDKILLLNTQVVAEVELEQLEETPLLLMLLEQVEMVQIYLQILQELLIVEFMLVVEEVVQELEELQELQDLAAEEQEVLQPYLALQRSETMEQLILEAVEVE